MTPDTSGSRDAAAGAGDDAPTGVVEVRPSPVHGLGVFACRTLGRGRRIGRFAGRRYTARQAARRDWDAQLTYVFGLSDGTLIDGGEGGNATRHLNHSCDPNCRAFELRAADGRIDIVFQTRRRVALDAELTIDYALDIGAADPAAYRCHCGAARCRGTMAAFRV